MTNRPRVLLVMGTRPEAIKMAPVRRRLARTCEVQVCVTAQHRQMLDQVLDFFGIRPDHDLDIMSSNQTLTRITTRILDGMSRVLDEAQPDHVFVHGDTTTTFSAALAAFYRGIPVGHVEAGLRTGDMRNPFPEEMNRKLTGSVASYHFAPTEGARTNLLAEGVSPESIIVTGNTAIDALQDTVAALQAAPRPVLFTPDHQRILVTVHRRESFGDGIRNVCTALRRIVDELDNAHLLLPVHFNPNIRQTVQDALGDHPSISLIEPLAYPDFVQQLAAADLIITDSGGVQEEAPSLGKPVLVMRECTERPEAVAAGTVILVGTDPDRITGTALELLTDSTRYQRMAQAVNPYGDGRAAERIASFMGFLAGQTDHPRRPEPFQVPS